MTDDLITPIGARPFRQACDSKGGVNTLPLSPSQAYEELKAGRLRTFMVGRRRYVSLEAIRDYITAREAESSQQDGD